jgi:hypothetical protein
MRRLDIARPRQRDLDQSGPQNGPFRATPKKLIGSMRPKLYAPKRNMTTAYRGLIRRSK